MGREPPSRVQPECPQWVGSGRTAAGRVASSIVSLVLQRVYEIASPRTWGGWRWSADDNRAMDWYPDCRSAHLLDRGFYCHSSGRGGPGEMADKSTCMSPSCGITIDGIVKECPQCGGLMRSSRSIRAFGWVTLICCLTALALMGSMFWTFSRGGAFTGTRGQALFFIGAASFLLLFVLVGFVDSLYRIATGRPNRRLVKTLMLLLSLYLLGMLLLSMIGNVTNLLSAFLG